MVLGDKVKRCYLLKFVGQLYSLCIDSNYMGVLGNRKDGIMFLIL